MRIIGIIKFEANFSQSLSDVYNFGISAEESAIAYSRINIFMDQSDYQLSFFTEKGIYDAYNIFVDELLTDCNISAKVGRLPVQFKKPIYGKHDADFKLTMGPVVVVV